MGKQIKIDMEQLEALCRLKPTLADCAAFFKCSEDTIERRIKESTGGTFAEFRDQNMVQTRYDLIRSAIKKSEKSDAMHIFCLKNICNWRDKHADEGPDVNINLTLADRVAKARARVKATTDKE